MSYFILYILSFQNPVYVVHLTAHLRFQVLNSQTRLVVLYSDWKTQVSARRSKQICSYKLLRAKEETATVKEKKCRDLLWLHTLRRPLGGGDVEADTWRMGRARGRVCSRDQCAGSSYARGGPRSSEGQGPPAGDQSHSLRKLNWCLSWAQAPERHGLLYILQLGAQLVQRMSMTNSSHTSQGSIS